MSPSTNSLGSVADASRLVAYGLRAKAKPSRDESYAELVKRYQTDDDFHATVHAVATGLDLVILNASDGQGLVVASSEDSVFAVRMSEYAKRTGGEGKAGERVLHALAHLGAATMAYPRPADLGNPAYRGRITVNGVQAFLREAADRLGKAAAERGENTDPPTDSPGLEEAWRTYTRRAATPSSGDGRRLSSSTLGIVAKTLTFLTDQAMLVRTGDDDGGSYATTARYRVQVMEAGRRMFDELLDIGITEVTDGKGTLVPVTWTTQDVSAL